MRRIVKDVLYRYEKNPLITQENIPFPCNTVFNGSPVKFNGEYLILMRVEGQQGYSFFALARSNKGFAYKVDERPVMLPAKSGKFAKYEERGIEDPRITFLDGTYYILYTAYSGYGARIAIAKTDDFEEFERIALISEPGNKDGVLFPEKINGMYARLDRPIGNEIGSIWISYSEDLIHWGHHKPVITPRPGYWDSYRIGASAPPIKTEKGWLEIFHGVRMRSRGPIYHAGTVLLDLEDPSKIISRCNEPILSPREDYERIGDVNNVVFASGAIVEEDRSIKVFYGAADTSICMATGNLDELLEVTCND
ncbi:MAG: glycoside hydrolase family 130 protein [Deltaproteobacteria bacterium]|nr:glycoside hydrolase family 130 protein [Deltaproteobacteria bacterium]